MTKGMPERDWIRRTANCPKCGAVKPDPCIHTGRGADTKNEIMQNHHERQKRAYAAYSINRVSIDLSEGDNEASEIEYVRADLHQALKAERDKLLVERDQMLEALEGLVGPSWKYSWLGEKEND